MFVTLTVSPLQSPSLHLSLTVHLSLSSHEWPSLVGSGTQQAFFISHFWHCGQLWEMPEEPGLPPQCQPALTIPTPGLATMTEPSSLTVAGPILTKWPRS